MPFSPELMALCQAQLNVLVQFDGSAQGVVYLSETGEDLCPVAVYPSIPAVNLLNRQFLLASEQEQGRAEQQASLEVLPFTKTLINGNLNSNLVLPAALPPSEQELLYQVVLPLQEDRYVLGALVVSRGDRDWHTSEYQWLEQVAETLTWASLMDRRLQWLQQQLQDQEAEANRQEDSLETLLHQIRNPLTALKTFGKLLLRRLPLQDQNRSVAEGIVRESDRVQFLLQELKNQFQPVSSPDWRKSVMPLALPGSILNTAKPSLPPPRATPLEDEGREVNLDTVLAGLIPAAQAIAEERDLQFSYTGLPIAPPVEAALNPLRETLSNLIDNALKYTPPGGSVQVQWLRPGGEYGGWQWVVVSDTGPGIPPEDLPHLFERHYRGVQSHGEIPGTGIGLAVAQDWMVQMGGQLEVISPAGEWRPQGSGGSGVAFRVWLKEPET